MSGPYRVNSDRIDWSLISEEDFNRVVEVLLVREHTNSEHVARALDGKGGDGGIDVGVWTRSPYRIEHIFQLKYFPEGFTGPYRKGRLPQIEKSFESAWKNHRPAFWTLVMPKNPHKNELEAVEGLPADRNVVVNVIGVAQLDELLAKHPDIEQAVLRDNLVEYLSKFNMEKAALIASTDLQERAEGLQALANDRSPHWNTSFAMTPNGYEEFYTPKHTEAMKYEPIETKFTISFGAQDAGIAKTVQKVLEYGSFGEVVLPPGSGKMERTGPSWVSPLRNGDDTIFSLGTRVTVPDRNEIVTLSLRDEWGFTKGKFEGIIRGRTGGTRGASIKVGFGNCLTAVIALDQPGVHDDKGRIDFDLELAGGSVQDALFAISLMETIQPGVCTEFYIDGQKLCLLQIDNDSEPWKADEYQMGILDDLVVLQKKTDLGFVFSANLTRRERVMLRVARLLLEGHGTQLPHGGIFTMELTGELGAKLAEDIATSGVAVYFVLPAFPFEFQNSRINLGAVTVYSRRAIAVNDQEVSEAIAAGQVEGLKVPIKSVAPESWWVHPGKVGLDPERQLEYSKWDLPEFENY